MEQTNTAGTTVPQQSVKGLSLKGIAQVFYQPAEFFTALKNQPRLLLVYIFLAIVFTAFFFMIADLVLQMQLESPDLERRLQGQPVTPQLKEIMLWQTRIGGPIFMILGPLVAALFAMIVGNFFMGLKKARFKQLWSVMAYGNVIYAVGALVMMPLMLAKDSLMISLSLGVLVANQGPESLIYLALSKIGVFVIWEIIVVGIGLAAVYDIPRNKGYVLSVLSVGMISILHVVFTAVGKAIF